MRANEFIVERRDAMFQYIKSIVPTWPDYVVQDWIYNLAKGNHQAGIGGWEEDPEWGFNRRTILKMIADNGLSPDTQWQLVPNMQFTLDMFDPKSKQKLIGRAGGSSDLGMGIPRDKERHATQAALAQQQGGVRKEPVLLLKTATGYELLEGWHRTIQHFAKYPDGYTGPAYVAVSQGQQGVVESVNDYLWHGSRYRNEVLVPRQANDTGGKEESNKNAIYATPSAKVAIAMGLTTPGSDTGMFPNDPQMVLFKGGIRKGEMVYLHKVPKDLFIKHNSREWYSKPDVKEITPIEVVTVPVDKWLSLIRTATPKDLELQKKNMKKQGVAEGKLVESAVFLNPTTVVVGQAHGQPLELSPNTLKQIQAIAAKHGAWYEGNGTDRGYTKGQIDRYVGSWDDEVAKTASSNDPKWLYVLFANVDENNRVQRVGINPNDTIFNRLLDTAKDNSFQGIGYTSQALQKFLQMASEGKYDFLKMSQQPATQENLTRFLKAGEALMWPSNWEQYPNKAGKIAKAATVDVRDQYLATRKAGVYVTGSGHLKAVQNITGKQGVAENRLGTLHLGPLTIEIDDHALDRARQRGIDPYAVDRILKKLTTRLDKLEKIELGERFWVYDLTSNIALGIRRLNNNRYYLKTMIGTQPQLMPGISKIITLKL